MAELVMANTGVAEGEMEVAVQDPLLAVAKAFGLDVTVEPHIDEEGKTVDVYRIIEMGGGEDSYMYADQLRNEVLQPMLQEAV